VRRKEKTAQARIERLTQAPSTKETKRKRKEKKIFISN